MKAFFLTLFLALDLFSPAQRAVASPRPCLESARAFEGYETLYPSFPENYAIIQEVVRSFFHPRNNRQAEKEDFVQEVTALLLEHYQAFLEKFPKSGGLFPRGFLYHFAKNKLIDVLRSYELGGYVGNDMAIKISRFVNSFTQSFKRLPTFSELLFGTGLSERQYFETYLHSVSFSRATDVPLDVKTQKPRNGIDDVVENHLISFASDHSHRASKGDIHLEIEEEEERQMVFRQLMEKVDSFENYLREIHEREKRKTMMYPKASERKFQDTIDNFREIFILHRIEGESLELIGIKLGLSETKVQKIHAELMNYLRDHMNIN